MKPPLLINLATKKGREDYLTMREPLLRSIEKHWKGDTWLLDDYPEGMRSHQEKKYAFKFDLIQKAVDEGYQFIWWIDCSIRLNGDIMPLLESSPTGILVFHNLGYQMAPYTSDLAMQNLECDSFIDNVPHLWAGIFGLDFTKPKPHELLEETLRQIELGSFESTGSTREDFIAPRNDQTVLSVLSHVLGAKPLPYGIIASVPDSTEQTIVVYGD